jgi:hypothetical protein
MRIVFQETHAIDNNHTCKPSCVVRMASQTMRRHDPCLNPHPIPAHPQSIPKKTSQSTKISVPELDIIPPASDRSQRRGIRVRIALHFPPRGARNHHDGTKRPCAASRVLTSVRHATWGRSLLHTSLAADAGAKFDALSESDSALGE